MGAIVMVAPILYKNAQKTGGLKGNCEIVRRIIYIIEKIFKIVLK